VPEVGRGTKVSTAAPVRGTWRPLDSPDDVLALMDEDPPPTDGVIAVVADAGATFLAPVFEDLTAVVCLSGTPLSHIGIVSRDYEVPCVMGTTLETQPQPGETVEVDCSGDEGIVRTP
jgi:signal transduction protein with GAF and PtsI domain